VVIWDTECERDRGSMLSKKKRIISLHFHGRSAFTPLLLILNQTNKVHAPKSYFFKIHFNLITPSTPCYSKWIRSFGFPYQNRVCMSLLSCTCHVPSQRNLPRFIVSLLLLSLLFYWRDTSN